MCSCISACPSPNKHIIWVKSAVHSPKGLNLDSELVLGVFWAEHKSNQYECCLPSTSLFDCICKNALIFNWGGGGMLMCPSVCVLISVSGSDGMAHIILIISMWDGRGHMWPYWGKHYWHYLKWSSSSRNHMFICMLTCPRGTADKLLLIKTPDLFLLESL